MTEIGTRCDLCGLAAGVRYLDRDSWACATCARLYVEELYQRG